MYVPAQTRQAYAEIDNFIELLNDEDRNKIPKKLRCFFKEEKDKQYIKDINIDIPIKQQNLKDETLALIALLNIKYICDDDKEKERLNKIYHDNNIKYQEILREKYNPNNIFKNRQQNTITSNSNEQDNKAMIEVKKTLFAKIINWFKNIFIK